VTAIDLAQWPAIDPERTVAAAAERDRAAAHPPFANVFGQALNVPLFSPWPPPQAAIPTPPRDAAPLLTQALDRNRPRDGRQQRRG